jgi:CRISPR system Cascade subunit CasC
MSPSVPAPFLTLHALQGFGPSLLNRDDQDVTKQIRFGDTQRVRVSSASAKRTIRTAMISMAIEGGQYGTRTTGFPLLAAQLLTDEYARPAESAKAKTSAVFTALKLKLADSGHTAAPIFASSGFAETTAKLIDQAWDLIGNKVPDEVSAGVRAALDVGSTIDLALFGRMLAGVPVGGRVDGAVSVGHAFSVDAAAIEPDFWTANNDAGDLGESMTTNLGMASLSAPVLYRVASLDRRLLRKNLAAASDPDQLAADAERSFVESFVTAVPTARQRSTVAATLPSVVVATCGRQILSAANAFATAIRGPNVVSGAVAALIDQLVRSGPIAGVGLCGVLSADPTIDVILTERQLTFSTDLDIFLNGLRT